MGFDIAADFLGGLSGPGEFLLAHAVVGKIDRRFRPADSADQRRPPAFVEIGQPAIILAQGRPALGVGLGIHQVGNRFGPGEVEAAIFHGPSAEFPRLGGAQAQRGQTIEQGLAHRPAAMNLELGDILPGETGGAGKPQQQTLIHHLAAHGKAPQHGAAGGRAGLPGQGLHCLPSFGA